MLKKFLMAAVMVVTVSAPTYGDLVTGWNFNNIPTILTTGTPTALGITSIASTAGTASGTVSLAGFAGNIDDFNGSTVNAVSGDSAGASLSLLGGGTAGLFPGNGGVIRFSTNLSGFQAPTVSFAVQKTNTGFVSNQFAYSLDGGTTFLTFGTAFNPATAYAIQTFDLTGVSGLANLSNAVFQIRFEGATGSTGNNRIDNFQINAVPEPTSIALLVMTGCVGLTAASRRRITKKTVLS